MIKPPEFDTGKASEIRGTILDAKKSYMSHMCRTHICQTLFEKNISKN